MIEVSSTEALVCEIRQRLKRMERDESTPLSDPVLQLHGKYDMRHGSPWDRGEADSYYHRCNEPHYYIGDTSRSPKVEAEDMTPEEIEAYCAGYLWNEYYGQKKNYD